MTQNGINCIKLAEIASNRPEKRENYKEYNAATG